MKENDKPDSSVTILPTEDNKTTRLFKLMNRLAANDLKRYKREQILFFPFFVADTQLEEFAKDIIKALDSVPSSESIDFVGAVRFEDMSSQRFDNFIQFLDRAGKRKDPQSIKLTWSKFLIDNGGEAVSGQVDLSFVTERPTKTGRTNEDTTQKAKVEVIVSGSDQRWVDQLFDDLIPMVKTTAHGGIMRPLWIFRHEWFAGILAGLASLTFAIWAFRITDKYIDISNEAYSLKVLNAINSTPNIEEKLKHYFEWTLSPKPSHFPQLITSIVLVIGIGAAIFVFLVLNIPRLAPSSAVAIGTAKRRALSSVDVFKFFVFTFIIGGFIIPLVRSGLSFLLNDFFK